MLTGYIYVWLLPSDKYISVGFVFACFDSNGNAKASTHGTSKESVSTLFYSFSNGFKARMTRTPQGVSEMYSCYQTH